MEKYEAGSYDIAVIGAGHAGCEAALAAARLGMETVLFTISLDDVANMPCNPSIGGTAKGHLVREIDALGGEMGRAADKTTIQSRMLNRGKGPAVHSLRAQIDRRAYHGLMKEIIENQEGLDLKQAEIVEITEEEGHVAAVCTRLGAVYRAKAVILASGTYLRSTIFVGDAVIESGPDGTLPANKLSQSLENLGIKLRRFKTGTPARVHRRSLDFDQMQIQEGDEETVPFSFETVEPPKNLVPCHIAYTNGETHRVIRENLHRSPLFGGQIEGVGPRYCPSIEDKVVRFAEKERHQLFVEPMGLDTQEMYLQGMSSSLPEDVQVKLYRSILGMEEVQIMRNAYAIEYDCCDPLDLLPTLEFKAVRGLYGAGQFNGTSGYEEAAAQGIYAAVNAVKAIRGEEPFILDRAGSYIGTLVDDLVTKGTNEPYRMMTSRSEYRLVLRQDNADQRLTPLGYELGLISEERYRAYLCKQEMVEGEVKALEKLNVPPSPELNALIREKGTSPLETGAKFADLLRRPQLTYKELAKVVDRPPLPSDVVEQAEITIKYRGYIDRQLAQVEQMRRLEEKPLPESIDYRSIQGLRLEAREKLDRIRPLNLGQASRISGVSPADVSVLMVWLLQQKGREEKA